MFFRAALFLPAIFSGVVIAYVWKWIYHPFAGVLNPALEVVGLRRFHTVLVGRSQDRSLFDVYRLHLGELSATRWSSSWPDCRTSPTDIFDAARVDGANFRQKLFRVTIPCLYDVFTFVITLRIFTAMGVFGVIYILDGRRTFLLV